ncbi:MAG: hypothetical protein JWM21_2205 [Acidobacteria bacterium]|nr:hypothetical protein [Acidobacteriota bacterium]
MKKVLFITVAISVSLSYASRVKAQDKRDQPLQGVFQTELVYPQEKGAFQLTSVFTFSKVNKEFSNDLTLEYGLSHSWQIDLQWQSFARKQTVGGLISHGSGDVRLGTKYSFMNIHGSNFHSAVGFELGLPAASAKKGISERKIEYEPYVVLAKDFPRLSRLQLFSQLGLSFARSITRSTLDEGSPNEKTVEWNSGMFVPYRRARFTNEISWSKGSRESNLYLTPGIVWKLPRDLEFGVGVPLGLSREADGFRVIVNLVYEFRATPDHR